MLDVGLLPLTPLWLDLSSRRIRQAIGAGFNDACDAVAEAISHILQPPASALVLGAVVQKARDREVVVAAIFQYRRGDRQKVGDVGRGRSFPELSSMHLRCVNEGAFKTVG